MSAPLPYHKFYRQIGVTRGKEAIYRDLTTGKIFIEKDHMYLVKPGRKDLVEAKFFGREKLKVKV